MCPIGCIECHRIFENGHAGSVSNSHGLCPKCSRLVLLETFRKQQRKEGLHDCAGRCLGSCSRSWCTYYTLCVNEEPTSQDFLEVEQRLTNRRVAKYGKPGGYYHHEVCAMAAG